jgi:hypothetical protein
MNYVNYQKFHFQTADHKKFYLNAENEVKYVFTKKILKLRLQQGKGNNKSSVHT